MFSTVTYSMMGVEPLSASSSTTSDWVDTDGWRRQGQESNFSYTVCVTEGGGGERGGGKRRREKRGAKEWRGEEWRRGERNSRSRGRGQAVAVSPLSRLCR